jgi:F-type H+-transporting ATPase subunit b
MSPNLLFPLAVLWAASSAPAEGHAAPLSQIIFPLINFLIFLYLVKRFLLPHVKDHLRSRRAQIVDAVTEAEEGEKRAERMVQDYRDRLARLDAEAQEIRAALRADGMREKGKLLAEAERMAVKIKKDAEFVSQQEVKVAQQRLRAEIAQIAQGAAAKVIQACFTPADQKRLLEEFLREVGGTQ